MSAQKRDDDFILKTGSGQTKKGISLPGGKLRLLIYAIISMLALSVIAVFITLFSGGGSEAAGPSLKLAQQHNEILRISDIGRQDARSPQAKSLATTTQLSLQSTKDRIEAIARRKNPELTEGAFLAGEDPTTDEELINARQNNRFDEVFLSIMYQQLREYRTQARIVFEATNSSTDKEALDAAYRQVNQLIPEESN